MPSVIGWLDQSEEHQRKMREVIDLFSESDSRDELGIGVVRDAFSNLLFPGLSTIQTRARYLLFIPWIFLDLERRRIPSGRFAERARESQTKLIYSLIEGGETEGVIGIEAREKLKRLPDTVYWNGLKTFGLRAFRGELSDYRRSMDRFYRRTSNYRSSEADEQTHGPPHNWHLAMPKAPDSLLKSTSLSLTSAEADYLRERMVRADQASLLAYLLRAGSRIDDAVTQPWDAVNADALGEELRERIRHARFFSELIWGAALLYNLLLAEKATARNLQSGGTARVDHYREKLDEWAGIMSVRDHELGSLDRYDFWRLVEATGARVPGSTRVFVDQWLDIALADGGNGQIADDPDARALIAEREHKLKRGMSRLNNPRQLEIWGGSSGSNRLVYRWPTAKTMVNDLVDGLSNA